MASQWDSWAADDFDLTPDAQTAVGDGPWPKANKNRLGITGSS
jgi:hypothetical protein